MRSVSHDTFLALWELNVRYAAALDQRDFAGWPALFAEDGKYKILSAENVRRGRNLPILNYTHPAMMRDRMIVLKEAAVFTQAAERRVFSNLSIAPLESGAYRATASFVIYRTDIIDGTTSLFVVGQYEDEVVVTDDRALFRARTAVVDTFSIPNHIGLPI